MTLPHHLPASGLPRHGGDLAAAEQRFGRPAGGWLDLSTGINPVPYPLAPLPDEVWTRLPDAALLARVSEAAARAYGAPEPACVAVGPGSQALIQWLPRLLPPTMVTVIGPTYGGHAPAWAEAGHAVTVGEGDHVSPDSRVVVVVNPNNPDGRVFAPEGLAELASALAARGGLLVVDEAFADPTPELSLAPRVGAGLLVLRSFGKFFGLAGLRLGFALAEPALAERLRAAMGAWAVAGPSLAVGAAALEDEAWIAATRKRLAREVQALDGILMRAGLKPVGGTPLFRLTMAPRAWALYEHLGQHGILVRPFEHEPRWLRIGLPADEPARDRLRAALAAWRG